MPVTWMTFDGLSVHEFVLTSDEHSVIDSNFPKTVYRNFATVNTRKNSISLNLYLNVGNINAYAAKFYL